MQRFTSVIFAALLLHCVLSADALAAESDAGKKVDFARDILPVLSNKCFTCHGPDGHEDTELRLDSFAGATSDENGNPAINLKNLTDSEILHRIHSADDPMPPEDADKQLTTAERERLTRWIKQGGKYAQHWAFVAPVKKTPAGLEDAPGSQVIDAFIGRQLKQQNADFAPAATLPTLARRASLVLTGLPPTPDALKQFLQDASANGRQAAYARFVDRLLASPQYGEHQARYWLDAIRYGDTHGLHLDNRRGIYPFRDWVVRAFNQNLPLDDFITWQLAGDLLEDPTLQQQVATGFVRMNPTTSEGGAIAAEFQAKNNFDRTETLGTVLLGLTMTCARCHTHKYDPVPQQEYYRLMAFFNSTAERSMDGNSYTYGPVIKAPANQKAWDEWEDIQNQRDKLLSQVTEETLQQLPAAEMKKWQAANRRQKLEMLAAANGPFKDSPLRADAETVFSRLLAAEKAFTTTLVAKDLPKPRVTKVLHRGEYNQPVGEALQPGIINVMGPLPSGAPSNRLGLAQWLTSRQHPVVSRVLINRVWQRTFGEGLVRTPEDFGLQGQQPTHPELLDWLAVELQDSGWDLKKMLRMMVTSRTFQQSSRMRPELNDPANRLFGRAMRRRLDAEVLRDMGLWASNLLDPQMGGEGVKPYQPSGLWQALAHPASNTKKYVRDKGDPLYRRSLYVYWKRTSPHPMMTLFDAPSRELSCVKRSRTSTSLQSLALLNETQRVEMARKLAGRLLAEKPTDEARLDLLFTLLASRSPNAKERQACTKLLTIMKQRYQESPEEAAGLLKTGDAPLNPDLNPVEAAAWTQVAITVLASDVAIILY